MTINYEITTSFAGKRTGRALLCSLMFTVLPGAVLAAEQEREQAALAEAEAAEKAADAAIAEDGSTTAVLNTGAATESPPPSEHATTQAPVELVLLAVHEPGQFIGKTLVLAGGNVITVGPVLNVRRRVENQEVYLIVDATAYFNSPTQYAVDVKDVDRIEGDKVIIPEAAGMHLRGLEYYPDDYIELVNPVQAPPSEANGD